MLTVALSEVSPAIGLSGITSPPAGVGVFAWATSPETVDEKVGVLASADGGLSAQWKLL